MMIFFASHPIADAAKQIPAAVLPILVQKTLKDASLKFSSGATCRSSPYSVEILRTAFIVVEINK